MTPDPMAEVAALAAVWARDLDRVAHEMFAVIAEQLPEATADPEISRLTLASCSSNAEAVLSMLRTGIAVTATGAPVTALEHARVMAARGHSTETTLRFYRLGHAYFWELWSKALVEAVSDRDRLAEAMRRTAAFIFGYVDVVSAQVNDEHIAERDRRRSRTALVRGDIVRQLLAGVAVDRARAERALDHRLDGPQLAFVCWTDSDPGGLERAALAIGEAAGVARPLLIADDARSLAGWLAKPVASLEPLRAAAATAAPEVHVAVGAQGGFRQTRETADRARRIAELEGAASPTWTEYADVALVDLLTRDLDVALRFAATELGALAEQPELCRTVCAVVAPGGGPAAAARAEGIHRNTVAQRVKRAEELRGQPTTVRPAELYAALLIVQSAHRLGRKAVDEGSART